MSSDRFSPYPLFHFPTSPAPRVAPPPPEPLPGEAVPPPIPEEEVEGEAEPWGLLDVEDPPEAYGVDEVTMLWRDPRTLFAHWEITAHGYSAAQHALGQEGALILRLESGGYVDEPLPRALGRGYLPAPRSGARFRAAIGLRAASGAFVAIAWAPEVLVPPDGIAPETPVTWMTVAPEEVGPPRIVAVEPAELPALRPPPPEPMAAPAPAPTSPVKRQP
ncbi:MAG TPA: DUF4912 domain-containing protein [Haliangiales bacterium]|nr:DUF4912 domain-containing protein [Haliangiales bacterium]